MLIRFWIPVRPVWNLQKENFAQVFFFSSVQYHEAVEDFHSEQNSVSYYWKVSRDLQRLVKTCPLSM